MKKRLILFLVFSLSMAFSLLAQPNIDICITHTGGNNLAVKIKPAGAFSGQFSNVEFTINPPSGVTLSTVNALYGIAVQSGTTFGHANAQSVNWTSGVEETILNLTFSGGSGTGNFTITGYYCELNGADKTGAVYCSASNVVLPLELLSFTATKQKTHSVLNWETIHESNVSHFEVEKSSNGLDFKDIGIAKPKGKANTKAGYALVDETPFDGVTYYRLKIIDIDNTFSYSNIASVEFQKKNTFKVYPVPTDYILNIDFVDSPNQTVDIFLMDITGKVVVSKSISLVNGNRETYLTVQSIPAGVYVLKVKTEQDTYTQKVMIGK